MESIGDLQGGGDELHADVFTRYRRALARKIARLIRPQDIDDVLQETYLRLYQATRGGAVRSPRAYMLKTVHNLALNELRRADALNHVVPVADEARVTDELRDADGDSMEPSPESVLESQQEFRVFCQAIRSLPRQCRRVFLLRRVYSLSQREVAQRLGISERTVENHIAKAAVQCSDFMEAHGFPRQSLNRAPRNVGGRSRE